MTGRGRLLSRVLPRTLVGTTAALGLVLVATAIAIGGDPPGVSGAAVPRSDPAEGTAGNGPRQPTVVPYRNSLGPRALDAPGTPPPSVVVGAPAGKSPPSAGSGPTTGPAGSPKGQRPGTVRLPRGGTARLVRREVGPDAVLPVPENLREATWWGAKLGARTGATVLAGHVNWQGATGPFAELWDAAAGDEVSVVDTSGRTWRYRVSRVVTVGKDELPARAQELFGQDGPPRLVLVTCGGRWVGGTTGYAANRIVIAEPAR